MLEAGNERSVRFSDYLSYIDTFDHDCFNSAAISHSACHNLSHLYSKQAGAKMQTVDVVECLKEKTRSTEKDPLKTIFLPICRTRQL